MTGAACRRPGEKGNRQRQARLSQSRADAEPVGLRTPLLHVSHIVAMN